VFINKEGDYRMMIQRSPFLFLLLGICIWKWKKLLLD